jgi:hypothetical protein
LPQTVNLIVQNNKMECTRILISVPFEKNK